MCRFLTLCSLSTGTAIVWNSPLCYVDESGEFLLGYTFGFFRGLFTGKNPFKTGWQGGVNEVKIWGGLFTTDARKNFLGQAWEMLSPVHLAESANLFRISLFHISNWAGRMLITGAVLRW